MKRFHALFVLVFIYVLTGCGGSSQSSDVSDDVVDDNNTTQNDAFVEGVVTTQDSPLQGHEGISLEVEPGSIVMSLMAFGPGIDVSTLDIVSRTDITDGDMSLALGGAFYRFDSHENVSPITYVKTQHTVSEVVACDPSEDYCSFVPFEKDAQGYISFYTRPAHFYGIGVERGEQ